jgi:IclR family transcriptional regulator, KDG regulon repressor
LLAHLGADDQAPILKRQPNLATEIEQTRMRGFAVSADELERGASGVASAILDRMGRPIASIGIVAPSPRLPDPATLGPRVRGLAREVSRRLGYTGD